MLKLAVFLAAFCYALALEDEQKAARYNPDTDNQYHLFTRSNPTVSQPIVQGNDALLLNSNFFAGRRTVILIHGRNGHILDGFNTNMIPAFIASDDVNVISVDWGPGAGEDFNDTVSSGLSVARFLSWLKSLTGITADDLHIVGMSRGGQHAGITARNTEGGILHLTALDASPGWEDTGHILNRDDAVYTECIWTGAGGMGHLGTLCDVDFFPNGGINMPGCGGNANCDHGRAFYYFCESIVTGGFTGTECATMEDARAGTCDLPGRLNMGQKHPSVGVSGIYYLETNAAPPFSIY